MNVYFVSGLGADSRVFKQLTLPSSITPIYIEWLVPNANETISNYAQRLSKIIDTTQPFVLVGLSFGGMVVTEMLAFVTPIKTILISSVTCKQELPFYYRWAGALKLHKLIPTAVQNKANSISYWIFGITSTNDKLLLKNILAVSNPIFTVWAINEIVNWKRATPLLSAIRIHGNNDKILPIINCTPQYVINGGGHFMIVNKAEEISSIIAKIFTLS
jgi:hypothetical protein